MDLAEGKIGAEGMFDLELKEGKLVLVADHKAAGSHAKLEVAVDPDYFIDKLAGVIPGTIDDAIFSVLKGALKAV